MLILLYIGVCTYNDSRVVDTKVFFVCIRLLYFKKKSDNKREKINFWIQISLNIFHMIISNSYICVSVSILTNNNKKMMEQILLQILTKCIILRIMKNKNYHNKLNALLCTFQY